MNIRFRLGVCATVVFITSFCSLSRAQDEQSLAYYAIRLDASSECYLSKAKSLLADLKIAKETKTALSPGKIAEYDADAKDYSARSLGEDGGSGGEAEWRVEEVYVAALSAKRACVDFLEFVVKHADIVKNERTISMNMLVQNAWLRLQKADEIMKGQAKQVRSEMESCSDKIGAVPRWEKNSQRYGAALTKENDLINELSKLTE